MSNIKIEKEENKDLRSQKSSSFKSKRDQSSGESLKKVNHPENP